eukprot:scaffold79313_cov55-Attheya_sp.AAC.2
MALRRHASHDLHPLFRFAQDKLIFMNHFERFFLCQILKIISQCGGTHIGTSLTYIILSSLSQFSILGSAPERTASAMIWASSRDPHRVHIIMHSTNMSTELFRTLFVPEDDTSGRISCDFLSFCFAMIQYPPLL